MEISTRFNIGETVFVPRLYVVDKIDYSCPLVTQVRFETTKYTVVDILINLLDKQVSYVLNRALDDTYEVVNESNICQYPEDVVSILNDCFNTKQFKGDFRLFEKNLGERHEQQAYKDS